MRSSLDLLQTICQFDGISIPTDRKYDGYNLSATLRNAAASPRDEMLFYHGTRIFAARKGAFKLYFYENNPDGYPENMRKLDTLRLFNVQHDPSEKFDIAAENPATIKDIQAMVKAHRATVDSVGSQLEKRITVNSK